MPNRSWRPDTVITDYEGTEMFVLLDQTNEMRSYEAIFGDLEGRRLVCVKRHLSAQFWKDGYYFCTYQPNWKGQAALADRDIDNKRVYPFSYLQVTAMKGRFFYRLFNNDQKTGPPRMMAENPWLGFMVVCCTNAVRMGKWTAQFKKATTGRTTIRVDQWRNTVDVGPGNDLLAALCMAYVFDRYQCQPFITVFGRNESDEYEEKDDDDDHSSEEDYQEYDRGLGDDDDAEKEGLTSGEAPKPVYGKDPVKAGYKAEERDNDKEDLKKPPSQVAAEKEAEDKAKKEEKTEPEIV